MKKKVFVAFILLLLCSVVHANAENIDVSPGSTIDGSAINSVGCQLYSQFCYSGAGIRISLYQYKNGAYKKVGYSHDIWSKKLTYPGKNKSWTSKSYHYSSLGNSNDGIKNRVKNETAWKTNGTTWTSSCTKCTKIKDKYTVFNLTYNKYKETGKIETTKDFADYTDNSDGNTENKKFREWINSYLDKKMQKTTDVNTYFGISGIGNVEEYYITVEPVFRIWVNTNKYDKNRKSTGYIGTVYELSQIYHYSRFSNALRSTSEKKGSFVGDILKKPKGPNHGGWGVLNQYAYGVAVYKLSDYTDPSCDCKKNDYKCAMNYCDKNAGESGRKDCVTKTCGVEDPGFSSCGKNETKIGNATNCASSANATNKTCTIGNTDNYYKTICSETNNVFYNDSLPTSIEPGMGFSYSLLLSGTKTCNTSFEVNKWNFDYAVSTNNGRKTLNNKLNSYKNLSNDSLSKYQYNSSNAAVTIDIEEKVDKEKNAKKITKKLKDFADVLKKDIKVSDLTSSTFKVMTNNKTTYKNKTFTSSMSSIYSLPDVCIDGASGKVYDAKYDDLTKKYICNKSSDGPYTKYFTNLKASIGINNTTVTINKDTSKIENLKNICYYQVEDKPLSCVISKNGNTYSLKVYSEYNIDYTKLRYSLSTNPSNNTWSSVVTSDNTLTRVEMPNNSFTLYGKVKYEGNDDMITVCSIQRPQKTTGEQCTVKYQPTEYDEIAKYCKFNWHTDKDSYISEKACYNACTGLDSCKVKYSCNDTINIESYCKSKYNPVTKANYYRACINDCSCSGGNAVYRPISLSNPFPNNRLPGANWKGYEKNIGDGSETDKAEYVVQLSASDIENIKNQTEKYNSGSKNAYIDYVWADKSDKNSKYISKFIHDTGSGGFTNLFCIIQGEGSCN